MDQIGISKVWKDREKEIFSLRNGGTSLAKIGERYGVSRERIRQVINVLKHRQSILTSKREV
jgi:DNA-directed RNA polymerase sigma subunit (sigma70/sigma32)